MEIVKTFDEGETIMNKANTFPLTTTIPTGAKTPGTIIKKLNDVYYNDGVMKFLSQYINTNSPKVKIFSSTNPYYLNGIHTECEAIANLHKINDMLHINTFLKSANEKLEKGAYFICCAETLDQRKRRLSKKFPSYVFYPYYLYDFITKRVFPKLELTRNLHFALTKGKNRAMSFTQVLGRLVYSGFRIVEFKEINNITYFIADKEKDPPKEAPSPSGLIFKMKRVGKDGQTIYVYKVRTMHPYAEYIQKYVYDMNGSVNGDKIVNDFRLASWGKVLRKLWLDELPMIINLFKGEIKLVGVRPLSLYKFGTYPDDVKKLRGSTKPGLFPPFYADLPGTFDELVESERKYLLAYQENPVKTDVKYFFKCVYNILIKRARSA